MKGDGTTLASILMIILLLAATYLHYSTVTKSAGREERISLREADILRAKNTFSLVSKSIGMTWFLSAVQSAFQTADESVGCGTDDVDFDTEDGAILPGRNELKELYWYQINRIKGRDSKNSDNREITEGEKYNSPYGNPRICKPGRENLIVYLAKKLKPFLDIKTSFTANDVDITINDLPEGEYINDVFKDVSLLKSNIKYTIGQKISAKYIGTEIDSVVIKENTIYTELPKMAYAGGLIADGLLELSDSLVYEETTDWKEKAEFSSDKTFDYSKRYQDITPAFTGLVPTPDNKTYLNDRDVEISLILGKASLNGPFSLGNAKIFYDKNAFELVASDNADITGAVMLDDDQGLVFHYDLDIRITDGDFSAESCRRFDTYDIFIEDAAKPAV